MKYVRFINNGTVQNGILEADAVNLLGGDFFSSRIETDTKFNLKHIKIVSPITPTKIIAVGLNYRDHAEELNLPIPEEPLLFMKPPSSVIGHSDTIIYPPQAKRVDYEAELAIIIKKKARNISFKNAEDYIFGYTCLNDVTARDLQKKDGQWTRAKSFDTFCPIGPHIETDLDTSSLKIELLLNGEIKQSSNTSKMIFDCKRLVEFISGIMTLEPGDVIATGTPSGVGAVKIGDVVEVRIEKLGSLINYVGKK